MSVWETIFAARAKRRQRQDKAHPPDLPCSQILPSALDVPDEVQEGDEAIFSDDESMGPSDHGSVNVSASQKQMVSEGECSSSDTDSGTEASGRDSPPPPSKPPREVARAIEFPELLQWVASNTRFVTGPPARARKPTTIRMASQEEPDIPTQAFVALSCSPAIIDLGARRVDDFAAAPGTGQVGNMAAPPRSSMKAYQFTTEEFTVQPLTYPDCKLPWMPHVNARSRSWVLDKDLVLFEQLGRESSALLSYLDAFLAAIASSLNNTPLVDPFCFKAISTAGNILAELASRAAVSTQHAVIHRRDLFLNGCKLSTEHVAALRLAPFVSSSTLFEHSLLKRVTDEHLENTKNEALTRVIHQAAVPPKSHGPKKPLASPKPQKRSSSATQASGEKKPKLSSPPPAQSGGTPKHSSTKKHR